MLPLIPICILWTLRKSVGKLDMLLGICFSPFSLLLYNLNLSPQTQLYIQQTLTQSKWKMEVLHIKASIWKKVPLLASQ